jgi:hypothetical protein
VVSHVAFVRVLGGWPKWAATPPHLRLPSLVPAYRTFVSYIDLVPNMCVCEVQEDRPHVFSDCGTHHSVLGSFPEGRVGLQAVFT